MDKETRIQKRKSNLAAIDNSKIKVKLSKTDFISYSKFRNKLIAKGTNIKIKYMQAFENKSYILCDIIKHKDFHLIERIITYYALKYQNSDSQVPVTKFVTARLTELKKNFNLFQDANLFHRSDIVRYLAGITTLLKIVIGEKIFMTRDNKSNIDYHLINQLITQGADVNEIPLSGLPLLHEAVFHQNLELVKFLIEKNACPNVKATTYEESLFFRAVKRDNYEIAECLIKAGAKVDEPSTEFSPLQWAASRRNYKMAEFIIQNGGDPNLICFGKTAMHYAVVAENEDLVHLLVKHKVDINAITLQERAETALGTAIKTHNLNLIKTIINLGADVNLFCRYVTPLQFAIIKYNYNSYRILEFLIKSGADVNADSSPASKFYGQKALHIAVQRGYEQLARLLMKNNADTEAVTNEGKTALGIAVEIGKFGLVESLVDAGVDVNKFSAGITPLDFAISAKNHKIVEYLIDHGADIYAITDDFNKNLDCGIKKLITEKILKLKAANFEISEANLVAIGLEFDNLYAKFCKEIELMKKIFVGDTTLSYFDTLRTSIHTMAMRFKYVADDQICNYGKLPLYAGMIKCRLEKTVERKKLLEKSYEVIGDIFYPELPDVFIRELFWYFSNRELKVLTGLLI